MAKREQRSETFHIIPFVTDGRAFIIADLGRRFVGQAQSRKLRMGELVSRGRKADWQVTRWIDLAGEDPRNRRAAANAGEEGLENYGNLVEPGHVDSAAAFDNHDRPGIGLCDRRDERILVVGEYEAAVISFAVVMGDEHHGDVRFFSE